jgi:DnaJ-class molecular chaperone
VNSSWGADARHADAVTGQEGSDVKEQSRSRGDDVNVEPEAAQTAENVCPACAGVGMVDGNQCARCGGTGTVTEIVGDA